ncbi:hypothetical protein [Thioalkalivibrio sp. ALE19]|uniref:hypothetical protein n=1 Tax=Thioalkalivibrio sp. ALE19 TaxID=1266909 RepID=UPI00048C36D0|nr:hypothetical protein [Thioalkalivibrio sp. ALE19]
MSTEERGAHQKHIGDDWVRLDRVQIVLFVIGLVVGFIVWPPVLSSILNLDEISIERYEKVTQMVEDQPDLRDTVARLMEEGCGLRDNEPCLSLSDLREIESRYANLTGERPSDRPARDLGVSIE